MVNPFINNKAPKLNKANKNTLEIDRSRIIDKDTFQKMMNHMTNKIKLSDNSPFNNFIAQSTFSGLLVAYMFGLRPQEIVGLKWSDLRTDKKGTHTLTVERAVTIAKDTTDSKFTTRPVLKGTKTGATRKLTVGQTVMNLFAARWINLAALRAHQHATCECEFKRSAPAAQKPPVLVSLRLPHFNRGEELNINRMEHNIRT